MELLTNIAITLLLLGLFLLVKNNDKKMFWGGILCIGAAVLLWVYAVNTDVTKNLIGVEVIKNTRAEYMVEIRYFDRKDTALQFYKQKGVRDFDLIYRFSGDTKDFFAMIGGKKTPSNVKRLVFLENKPKKQSALEEYQNFFLKFNLMPAYHATSSPFKK